MSDEVTTEAGGAGGDSTPDNPLYRLYERYIGEPEEETDVYLGFGLFFSGIVVGVVALVLAMVSFSTLEPQSDAFWNWTRISYALGMLALPATITGIVVLLPVERRAVYASVIGSVLDLGAVVWFVSVYPSQWNDYGAGTTLGVISLYALGLVLVVGSTGAALVADQLERYKKPGPADIQPVEEEDDEEGEHYSDEEIAADIEDAMSGVDLSWGGVEKSDNRNLDFNIDDGDMDTSGFSQKTAKVTRSSGIDSQLSNLKAMRGGEKKTATSNSTVDDQTQKLKELRERRQREAERKEEDASLGGVDSSPGFWSKLKRTLGLG
ncbi:DUF7139 domain-containing protein [Haloarchaeobius amylolyticus]|uniref:DUF7139 domain-containing protein n=1 Tax=Haloarchaeobius amylolyticus TaxID=1198296 RepID=UPI002270C640|nr:hypothetical protein [Haloarchaeobius amylolyticus]